MKPISRLAMFILGLTLALHASGQQPTLDGYIAEALENNPRLKQRYSEWQAALERIPQARSLEDPVFTYGQFIVSEVQRAKFAVQQKIPWFGTRQLRADKAAAEAEARLDMMFADRDEIVFEVKRRYYDYALLGQRIEILTAQLEVLDFIEDTVRAKLALGLASDDELLRVSITRTELEDRLTSLDQLRPAMARQLTSILGRTDYELLPWPTVDELPPPPPPVPVIAGRIRAAHPSIAAIEHRIEAIGYQEELARKSGFPNFTFGVEWTLNSKPRQIRPERPYPATLNAASRSIGTLTGANPFVLRNAAIDAYSLSTANEPFVTSDGGEDNLMVSVSVNVPIWRKKTKAAKREARNLHDAASKELEALYLSLEETAQLTRFEIENAARRYELFQKSLIPQSEMTYESLQDQYSADIQGITFAEVLASINQILNFQLEQAHAHTQCHQATAKLHMLMGAQSPEIPGKENQESGDIHE